MKAKCIKRLDVFNKEVITLGIHEGEVFEVDNGQVVDINDNIIIGIDDEYFDKYFKILKPTTAEYMKSLPLGTRLHVLNGNWYCRICGSKEEKKVYMEWSGETFIIDEGVNHLEVEVIK